MKTLPILFVSALIFAPLSFADVKLGSREVILDNDKVEVVRLVYPAGAESGMHTHKHPNRTVYFIKGGKLKLTPANKDEKAKILTVPDGKILYLPAGTHNVKNIGDSEVIIIENEIK
ncbi:MAG: hypothetical protein HRT38_13925 [Alteromonadaceae bacterium]|nr:hypothetical protein [Alteromonadaceae bacterium]